MNAEQLLERIEGGALGAYAHLYGDIAGQTVRYAAAVREFVSLYGDGKISLYSVPGRTEVQGNHTDHNHGCVLAAAIDRDIIAVVSPTDDGLIRIKSEGYDEDVVALADCDDPDAFADFSSASLIAGTVAAFRARGFAVGGFRAYTQNRVLKGSGLSSSAAFEVMIGNIFNHFYNDGKIDAPTLAKIGQEAENVFFGKPCGLMDQTACAVGGFVAIDFADPSAPVIEKLPFDLSAAGYRLCIINTGGNHADLNDDYASVPAEMTAVAAHLGQKVLRPISYEQLLCAIPSLRKQVGDRAILRAIHFILENERVRVQTQALKQNDIAGFLDGVTASGNSSYKRLQNVFTTKNVAEQGLSLALALAEEFLAAHKGDLPAACRVHGGGFAGTIQAFVPDSLAQQFCSHMDAVFGQGASHILRIRPYGAICTDKLR